MNDELESQDTVNASALDVISCGLGAAIFLFLVLSVVRSSSPGTGGTEEFVEILITVSGDSQALVAPVLQPPGADAPIVVPLLAVDRVSGRFVPDPGKLGVDLNEMSVLRAAADEYQLLGFSLIGDTYVMAHNANRREFRVNVLKPKAGLWKISVRWINVDQDMTIPRIGGPALKVSLIAKSRTDTQEISKAEIHFGDETPLLGVQTRESKKR